MMRMLLTAAVLKRFLYFVCYIATLITLFYSEIDNNYPWLLFATLFFSIGLFGDSIKQRFLILSLMIIAMFGMVALIGLTGERVIWQAGSLVLITAICVYLSKQYIGSLVPMFLLNLVAILTLPLSLSIYSSSWIVKVLISGAIIGVALQVILLIRFYRDELSFWQDAALTILTQLATDIFSCLILPEYNDNLYLFERRLHTQKMKYAKSIVKTRWFAKKLVGKNKQQAELLIERLDRLYTVLIDCAQLRRRITDYTVFQLCEIELKVISRNVVVLLTSIRRNTNLDLSSLNESISKLEATYHQVVKIATREPLAFLLFIFSLKMLAEELESFAT